MQAAEPSRVESILQEIARLPDVALHAVPLQQRAVQARVAATGLSAHEISEVSSAFLAERRAPASRILTDGTGEPYGMKNVDFVFLPMAGSIAATFVSEEQAWVLLSLGLVETLKLACVSGQLCSAIDKLEHDAVVRAEVGDAALSSMVKTLRTMVQTLNAAAVLQFVDAGPIPSVVAGLDEQTQRRAGVTLEAVLMFVLLHELGHVDYRRSRPSPQALPSPITASSSRSATSLVWEFAVPEALNARQEEELHADRHAMLSVPPRFRLPLAHAATFFLHLHGYVESISPKRSTTHPLSVNRLAALQELAASSEPDDAVGRRAIHEALSSGVGFWEQREEQALPQRLESLRQFVRNAAAVDWRPAREALLLLAARDQGSHG